jgi:hypothetical protein
MEQEGAVGNMLDLDARQGVNSVDDSTDMCLVGSEHGDVSDLLPLLDTNEVDRSE